MTSEKDANGTKQKPHRKMSHLNIMKLDQIQKEAYCLMIFSSTLSAKRITMIVARNVQTLYQTGKLAQLLHEFDLCKLDIPGIGDVRGLWHGKIDSEGKTILYSGSDDWYMCGLASC